MKRAHGLDRLPLCVTHGHVVPLRSQIVAGLACSVLDRLVAPGEVLPSTRELAQRLGVHRNTVAAAYRELRARGLLTGSIGARPRVIRLGYSPDGAGPMPLEREDVDAIRLLRELAVRAFEAGVPRPRLRVPLGGPPDAPGLVLIEPRSGLRSVLGAELRMRADPRVVECDGRTGTLGSDGLEGAVVMTRMVIAGRVGERLPRVSEILPLTLVGGSVALARARRVRLPGVVVLLTRSAGIRSYARDLTAGHHAAGLSLAAPDPADFRAVDRATRIARLILVDASCLGISFETRAPVRRLWIVSDQTVRRLRQYLGG